MAYLNSNWPSFLISKVRFISLPNCMGPKFKFLNGEIANLLNTASTETKIGIYWCSSCYSPSRMSIVMSEFCLDLVSFFSTLLINLTLILISSLGCN